VIDVVKICPTCVFDHPKGVPNLIRLRFKRSTCVYNFDLLPLSVTDNYMVVALVFDLCIPKNKKQKQKQKQRKKCKNKEF
jgi:hypothetical protein